MTVAFCLSRSISAAKNGATYVTVAAPAVVEASTGNYKLNYSQDLLLNAIVGINKHINRHKCMPEKHEAISLVAL